MLDLEQTIQTMTRHHDQDIFAVGGKNFTKLLKLQPTITNANTSSIMTSNLLGTSIENLEFKQLKVFKQTKSSTKAGTNDLQFNTFNTNLLASASLQIIK